MAANTLTLSLHYSRVQQRTFTQVALLTGYFLLGAGVAAFFFVAFARVWGKRHLFILGSIILIFSSAWAGASGTNFKSMLWARIFQGIGAAPYETLVNATVGDLYFVHQRGKRMAITNLAVFGGAFMTPVLVGKITHTLGWEWTFYFETIFCAACLPAIVFLVPETSYRRSSMLNTDLHNDSDDTPDTKMHREDGRNEKYPSHSDSSKLTRINNQNPSSDENLSSTRHDVGATTPKQSFLKTLMPFSGRYTKDNFFKILVRPLPLFFHPAILDRKSVV